MKTLFILFFSTTWIFCFNTMQAQILDYAINMGGQNFDNGVSIVTDNFGNNYSTGNFSGVATFGNNTLTAYQGSAYILKTNQVGNIVWAKYFPGAYGTTGKSITIDTIGNLYVTGYFYGTVDFDPGVGITNLTSAGNSDVFVIKMDSVGNLIWAKNMGGVSNEQSVSIKVDNAGNIFTLGYYLYDGDYDPSNNVYTLLFSGNTGDQNMFLSKLDNNGNFVWAKSINQTGNISPTSLDIDAFGNLYSTGNYSGIIDFDPGVNVYNLLPPLGMFNSSCFMLKLNNNGNFITVKNFTNGGNSKNIKIDNNSDICITGFFIATDDFDPDTLTNYPLTSMGVMDVFILKLNNSGNFLWAKSFGGIGYDQAFGLTTDNFNNIYITGLFSYNVDFDPNAGIYNLAETSQTGQGDVFVSKLDSLGNFLWAVDWGGSSYDQGNSIAIASNGNVVSTGYFELGCDFDPDSSASYYLYGDYADAYISSLGNTTNITVNICSNQLPYIFNNQNLISSGIYYDTLINVNNTDSIIQLNLIVNLSTSNTINQTSCSSFTFNGQQLTSSGTYYDTLVNANGCDSLIILNLTVNNINVTVTQAAASLSSNENAAMYQWLNCPTYTIIPGATSQSYTATSNGSYAVRITKNNCIDTSTCYTVTGLGNNEHYTMPTFVIFPNPTNDIITISSPYGSINSKIKILNCLGQTILTQVPNDLNTSIDLSILAVGVYYIEIKKDNQTYRTKVVKN